MYSVPPLNPLFDSALLAGVPRLSSAMRFVGRVAGDAEQQQQLALERDPELVASDTSESTLIGVTVRSNKFMTHKIKIPLQFHNY